MFVKRTFRWTVLATVVTAMALAAAAGATPPSGTPATIQLSFSQGGSGTFTATGIGSCTSGTTLDSGNGGGTRTTLTCGDGSGSFALHFSQYGKGAVPGKWAVVQNSGTLAYVGMSGSGTVASDNCGPSLPCEADLAGNVSLG